MQWSPAIMQPIHWNDLQDFLAIARAGQLARAAALASVDATTMGRRLRRLEMRLGQTLFEQTREGQVLTESGEVLLAQVEGMEAAAGRIAEGVRPASGLSGTVRISLSEGFGTWIVARQIHRFVAAHPGLTLDLVASSGFLSPSKREADIAVVLSRPRAGPVIASKLSDYELQLYATPAYLAATGTPTQAAELAHGHRLIGYIPDLLYAPELRYLDGLHPGLAATVRSSSINAQHRLIAAGTGIGVLPCFIGNTDPTLVPVLPARRIRRSFWLVTHKDTHQLARVRACRDWLLETVQRNREILLPVTKR